MQTTAWRPTLTTIIQHDAFNSAVDRIREKSAELLAFYPERKGLPSLEPTGDTHLTLRSQARRQLYQRPNITSRYVK